MKYVTAVISFVFMFVAVALIVGMVMMFLLPPNGPVVVGIGTDWRNLPGTILGIFAGVHSAKAALGPKPKKEKRIQ